MKSLVALVVIGWAASQFLLASASAWIVTIKCENDPYVVVNDSLTFTASAEYETSDGNGVEGSYFVYDWSYAPAEATGTVDDPDGYYSKITLTYPELTNGTIVPVSVVVRDVRGNPDGSLTECFIVGKATFNAYVVKAVIAAPAESDGGGTESKGTNVAQAAKSDDSGSGKPQTNDQPVEFKGPSKLGITSTGKKGARHDRAQKYTAQVKPKQAVGKVEIMGDVRVAAYGKNPDATTGIIAFTAEGIKKSEAKADALLTATMNGKKCGDYKITVVVPAKVGTPHPQFDNDVGGYNFCADADSSPATQTAPGMVDLVTEYVAFLTVLVVDKWDDPVGKLYAGSDIYEQYPINQTLASDSTYQDPVGTVMSAGNIVVKGSSEAKDWLGADKAALVGDPEVQNIFFLSVDGFSLNPAILGRKVTPTPPSHIKVEWPDSSN